MSAAEQLDMLSGILPTDDPNCRYVLRPVIERWHRRFRFTRDVASAPDAPSSQVIGRFWTKADDALSRSWVGERAYCNPPFDDIRAWLEHVWAQLRAGCELVVMLLPNWTDREWWHDMVEPFRDGRGLRVPGVRLTTEFLPRMGFGNPGNPEGRDLGSPNFWCVLLVWERV